MLLVTGGSGIVGARLLYDLHSREKKIRAIRGLSGDMSIFESYCRDAPTLRNKIEWVDADIRDPSSVHEIMHGCKRVYHCAAKVSFNSSEKNMLYDINVNGTANVVNACLEHQVEKLCYTSSVAAIGREKSVPFITEDSKWTNSKHNTNYAVSKYNAELEVWRGVNEGLKAVIVNPTVILGRGNWDKGSSSIFKRVYKGVPFCPPGANGFVDVRDVSKAMIQLMESDIVNQRFVLNGENCSYKYLITEINKAYGKQVDLKPAGKSMMEIAWRTSWFLSKLTGGAPLISKETVRTSSNSYKYSSDKIKGSLNYNFIPIKETIHYTAGLFKKEYALLR